MKNLSGLRLAGALMPWIVACATGVDGSARLRVAATPIPAVVRSNAVLLDLPIVVENNTDRVLQYSLCDLAIERQDGTSWVQIWHIVCNASSPTRLYLEPGTSATHSMEIRSSRSPTEFPAGSLAAEFKYRAKFDRLETPSGNRPLQERVSNEFSLTISS